MHCPVLRLSRLDHLGSLPRLQSIIDCLALLPSAQAHLLRSSRRKFSTYFVDSVAQSDPSDNPVWASPSWRAVSPRFLRMLGAMEGLSSVVALRRGTH